MDRSEIIQRLQAQIRVNGHIIGAAVGSGMTAKYVAMGGGDFLLALSAGKYRLMGRSSYAGYLSCGNNNEIVMELGTKELFPILPDMPILFGLFASDPTIHIYEYLKLIQQNGFSGIVNYPTLSLIDGKFRQALAEENTSFQSEVEAVRLAHILDLFTIAFVTTKEECQQMLAAGADVICVHLGLTKGGLMGAKRYFSLNEARSMTDDIFQYCTDHYPAIIRMIYAGSISTPSELEYIYQNTSCQGYIGGSTFDRIPAEKAILETTRMFKSGPEASNAITNLLKGSVYSGGYADFVKDYIGEHFDQPIQLRDLALVAHVSASYLSIRFKKETGMNFTNYLIQYRINKAKAWLCGPMNCQEVAGKVGYPDYVQFSKIFRKYVGVSPKIYKNRNQE